jgi:hypothetical protein
MAFASWKALIAELDKLYLRRQYYVREAEAIRAMELENSSGGNYVDSEKALEMESRVQPAEFFDERWQYYLKECRGMLQRWAALELSRGKIERTAMIYHLGVKMMRGMVERNVLNADRFLVVSLLTYAKLMEIIEKNPNKAFFAFTEAMSLILKRTQADCSIDDFEMFHHVVLGISSILKGSNLAKLIGEIMELYINSLEKMKIPLPALTHWQELCTLPEVEPYTETFRKRCNKLLEKHPEKKNK